MTVRAGTVYLVGAGPGDRDFITVRGLELLQRADVVLHDRLVLESLLLEARPGCEVIDVGKAASGDSARQTEINAALVTHARAGRVVVRLKGGDPFIFGRGWEERAACIEAGVPCEVVPGLSSALAAPAVADIPVTCRGVASSVTICAAPMITDASLRGLAQADTSIFLMGVGGMISLAERLMAQGHASDVPCAVIERATMPGQRVVRGTLATIGAQATLAQIDAPAVLVVGKVTALAESSVKPLHGRRVLVTRPTHAATQLTSALRALGADVIAAPLIRVEYVGAISDQRMTSVRDADWLVFTSRHGVRGFRRALEARGSDVRALAHLRIAAVGPIAARELETWGLRADLVANPARESALVSALSGVTPVPRRVVFPCGTLALESLPNALEVNGIDVVRLPVYRTHAVPLDDRIRRIVNNGVDAILLASPSAAVALRQSRVTVGDTLVACLGQVTAAAAANTAASESWTNVVVATSHSDEGLINTLLERLSSTTHTTMDTTMNTTKVPAAATSAGRAGTNPRAQAVQFRLV